MGKIILIIVTLVLVGGCHSDNRVRIKPVVKVDYSLQTNRRLRAIAVEYLRAETSVEHSSFVPTKPGE